MQRRLAYLVVIVAAAVAAGLPGPRAQGDAVQFVLTATPDCVAPGGLVTGDWTVPSGQPANDWVGWYRVGSPHTAIIEWTYTGDAATGSLTVDGLATQTPGTYQFRYFLGGESELRAASNPVTVGDCPPDFALTVTTPTKVPYPGGQWEVCWSAPEGRPSSDWIGLHRVGDPDNYYRDYRYTGGASTGCAAFNAPGSLGWYQFRYLLEGGYTDATASEPVVVALNVNLSADPAGGVVGDQFDLSADVGGTASGPMRFEFDCTNDGIPDYIVDDITEEPYTAVDVCKYPAQDRYTAWVQVCREGLCATDTLSIKVVACCFSLTASPEIVPPGGEVDVCWEAPPLRPTSDWIGLYRQGQPNTSYINYLYTDGEEAGCKTVPMPAQDGKYEFRYMIQGSYADVATSNKVKVGEIELPDLTVSKVDSPNPVDSGGQVTYTVTVGNEGTANADGVVVEDTLPANGSFKSATPSQGSCDPPVDGMLTCNLGNLLPGASATVEVLVNAPAGPASMTNCAGIDPDNTIAESNELNNGPECEDTDVLSPPDGVQGDVNCDGEVTVVDALFILQREVGLREDHNGCPLPPPPPDTLNDKACDVDKDEQCNVVDPLFILQCEVGLEPGANMPFCVGQAAPVLAAASSQADGGPG